LSDVRQYLGGDLWLVSFDSGGSIGGVAFAEEDVLRYDQSIATWSIEFDASSEPWNGTGAQLDAVSVPEPGVGTAPSTRHT
jgi:hypothetical protein